MLQSYISVTLVIIIEVIAETKSHVCTGLYIFATLPSPLLPLPSSVSYRGTTIVVTLSRRYHRRYCDYHHWYVIATLPSFATLPSSSLLPPRTEWRSVNVPAFHSRLEFGTGSNPILCALVLGASMWRLELPLNCNVID